MTKKKIDMRAILNGVAENRRERRKVRAMERLAEAMERQVPQSDKALQEIQEAFNQIQNETGKAPSQRAVAARAGYDRSTVRARWNQIKS